MTHLASKVDSSGFAPSRTPMATHVNVSEVERALSALAGGGLAIYGISRGSLGGAALAAVGASLVYRGVTGHCHLYEALGVDTSQHHNRATAVPAQAGVRVEKTITINRSPEEVYAFWRDFENLAQFMEHLESVKTEGNRSHWVAKAPLGMTVEWDAEVYNETPGEMIAWRSLEGSEVDTAGSVHFKPAPGGRGTEVTVNLKYNPPGGKVGAAFAKLFGEEPSQQISEDLRRFKRIMETGEIPTVAGQSSARRAK